VSSSSYSVCVENLGKSFHIGTSQQPQPMSGLQTALNMVKEPLRRTKAVLQGRLPQFSTELFWALKDVSFEIQPGEVVGVIGHNGAGKSTLLKILARITPPTEGRAHLRGQVAALLEVGTGFNQELTGRENIYLNGSILGMTKREIDRKLDDIVEFAGIGDYLDTPVKRYSSGMGVRLGFAVAAHLEPDILLVDEVLSVGDLAFQQKSLGKMNDVARGGRTVIFVSHNMETVQGLCPRTIWVDQGTIRMDGNSQDVIRAYIEASIVSASNEFPDPETRIGDGKIRFTGFHIRDEVGSPISSIMSGQTVEFVCSYEGKAPLKGAITTWIWITDNMDRRLIRLWTQLVGQDFEELPAEGKLICRVPNFPLTPGTYYVDLDLVISNERTDYVRHASKLEVVPGDFFGTGQRLHKVGAFMCQHDWRYEAEH
jgi:lipopolysaccharide transport system ATP-binding protein